MRPWPHNFDNLGAEGLVDANRFVPGGFDLGIETGDGVFFGDTDAQRLDRLIDRGAVIGNGLVDAGGVFGIVTGDGLEQESAVGNGPREGADLIEG